MANLEIPRIWLCDLTYVQQTIASDIMPAAVGCIATYTEAHLDCEIETRIFKFPEKLAAALEKGPAPHVIGFSNYAWNQNLSKEFARSIKKHLPHVVTIFGGPNYPTTSHEQEAFLRALPMADFYVVKEGEAAFARLVDDLIHADFDVTRISKELPSIHRVMPDGTFQAAKTEDRLLDMDQIPSPYLCGKMDEFFDGRMLPIIQTNRGCPFRCTFCVEGMPYYSRVAKSSRTRVCDELDYIAEKMAGLRDTGHGRTDLHIADSNFGMYKEDIAVCHHIAGLQVKFGYPEYINVATGKNHKKRVLEAASIINGALRLSGSVQSLDRTVLANIDRSNINEKEIMDLALEASKIGANNYSEIILALPGDTRTAHFNTIRSVVEADFNTVALYQLMLLPGTSLASKESVAKWDMVTKYRALPRCYGYFDCLGDEINTAEIEEICIANNSLSFDDYMDCRRFHLIINVFYNDGVFKEILRLIRSLGLSKFEWLERLFNYRENAEFENFIDGYINETKSELWDSRSDLENFVNKRENVTRFIEGEFGANLIFKYRSIALIKHTKALSEIARHVTDRMLDEHECSAAIQLSRELITLSLFRMSDIFFNLDVAHSTTFSYAVNEFADDLNPKNADEYLLDTPIEVAFELTPDQKQTIRNFLAVYGNSLAGLSRILAKVYMRKLFRTPATAVGASEQLSGRDAAIGDGQRSGLNEFV